MIVPMMLAAIAAPVPAGDARADVEAAMAVSAAGWNAGSLDRFMAVYADDAMFVTAKGVLRGKAEIAAHYRPSFAGGANSRGSLSFRTLAFRTISNVHLLLVARWTLTPAGGGAPETGMTTLLFERRPQGWRIVADHSS